MEQVRLIIATMGVLRRTKRAPAALVLAGLLALGSLRIHSEEQSPHYVLKEKVHLVIVPVTVKDRQGDLVDDLLQQDFRVFEDGQERPIQVFANEASPLAAVILLDTGMSGYALAAVRARLASLSDAFAPEDEEALYLFDSSIRLVQDFSSQPESLPEVAAKAMPEGSGPSLLGGPLASARQVNGAPLGGPTGAPTAGPASPVGKRIYDALYVAAQRLKTRPVGRRRVVVIVSDGVNGSDNEFSYDQALEALTASDVTVYAASFGSGWAMKRADLLARVARETGGDIAYVQRRSGLDRAFTRLTQEARNAYILGFPPLSADGAFHAIRVRVAGRGHRSIARSRFLSLPAN